MTINITYLGHSGFLISDVNNPQHAVAIDPWLTGNPVAKHTLADINCSHVIISHGHADHFGDDTFAIANANNAAVVAAFEITEYCTAHGVANCEPMNPGGRIETPFGYVALTKALHSSSYNGQYMGMPCGIILNIANTTIYHAGDTDLFSDMKLIAEIYKPDIAILPIGDRYTMGPELASLAAEWLAPKFVIPMHYNTMPAIEQDPTKLNAPAISTKILNPAESWQFG